MSFFLPSHRDSIDRYGFAVIAVVLLQTMFFMLIGTPQAALASPLVYGIYSLFCFLPVLTVIRAPYQVQSLLKQWVFGCICALVAMMVILFISGLLSGLVNGLDLYGGLSNAVLGIVVGVVFSCISIVLMLPGHVSALFLASRLNKRKLSSAAIKVFD
jgi:hypothetical protein